MGFSVDISREMNKSLAENDVEEGEIIEEDISDIFEDISSDEEFSMRKRIEELEARNLELEKIANISGIYNFDISKADVGYSNERHRNGMVTLDLSDIGDYHKTSSHIKKRSTKKHPINKHSKATAASAAAVAVVSGSQGRKRRRRNSTTSEDLHVVKSRITIPSPVIKSNNYEKSRKRKYERIPRNKLEKRKPEKVKKKISKPNSYSSSDDEICALNRDELRMALKRDSRTPNIKSSFNSIRKSFDLQPNVPIPVIDLDKDDDNFPVNGIQNFRGTIIDDGDDDEVDEKRSLIESDDSVSIEEQELRLIALKSAVLKKHLARKKRKENEQKKPYSPTDFLGINNSSPKPPLLEMVNCNSMDISPVESPEFFSEDCSLKPIDMDLVDGSDSDTPIFIGECAKTTTQWEPIDKLPLTESVDIITAPLPIIPPLPPPPPPPITRNQHDEDIVEINSKTSSPEPTDEEELALRALLLSKLNSPKQPIKKTNISTNDLRLNTNVNDVPEKILTFPTVDQQSNNNIIDHHDASLDAESLRNFLLSTMKKKPINETEFVLKEAVRRLQGKPNQQQHRSDDSCDNSRSGTFIEDHNTISRPNSSLCNNNNNNEDEIAKDVESIVNEFQNVNLEGTSLEDHFQKILKDTELYASDCIQPPAKETQVEPLKQQHKIKTHVTRRSYKTDKKDLGIIAANNKINKINNIIKSDNTNSIPNQNIVVIDPASNFNNDISNAATVPKISQNNYNQNNNTIQIRLTTSPIHNIVPAKIIKKSSTKLVNTQNVTATPIPIPILVSSTAAIPTTAAPAAKISSPISTKMKPINKTLLRTSVAKTNSIVNKTKSLPTTPITGSKTTTVARTVTAGTTVTAPKTVIASNTGTAVNAVARPTTKPATLIKPSTAVKTGSKPMPVIKTNSASRLITSFIGRHVNKMIIHVSRSDSESDFDCDGGLGGANTNPLTPVANEYFDNASPKSLQMESPCSSPMTVSNSLSVPNATAAATASIASQVSITGAGTKNSVDNKENQISVNQVVNKSVVNDVFQARLDQLLRNARKEAELIKKDVPTTTTTTTTTTVKPANDIAIQNTPVAVRHLPASSQLEYRRLISRMKILERQRAAKNTNILANKNSIIQVTINNEKAIETKLEHPPILKAIRSIVNVPSESSRNINSNKIENNLNGPLLKKVLLKTVTIPMPVPAPIPVSTPLSTPVSTTTAIPMVVTTSVTMATSNTTTTPLPNTEIPEKISVKSESTEEKIMELPKQDEVVEEPMIIESLSSEQTTETISEEITESTSTKKVDRVKNICQEESVNDICQDEPINDICQEVPVNDICQEEPVNDICQDEPVKDICEEVISLEPEDKLNLLAAYESGHQINSTYLLETIVDTLDIVTKAKNEKLIKLTLESDIKKLKQQLFKMEKDLEVQNKKIAKIYPEIANSHKSIVQLQQKCTELHKLSTILGKQVIGKSYNLKIEHTLIINEKSKQLKLEINQLKNLKRDCDNDDDDDDHDDRVVIQDVTKLKKSRKISEKTNSPTKKTKQMKLTSGCKTSNNDNKAISRIKEVNSNLINKMNNIKSKMISENVPKKCDDDVIILDDDSLKSNNEIEITARSCSDDERTMTTTTSNEAITSKNDLNRCTDDDDDDDDNDDHNEMDVVTEENKKEEEITESYSESIMHVDKDNDNVENPIDSSRTKVIYISPLDHMNYAREINPNGIICPYQLKGQCDDKECNYEHFRYENKEMTR